jgi:hypothetical protein
MRVRIIRLVVIVVDASVFEYLLSMVIWVIIVEALARGLPAGERTMSGKHDQRLVRISLELYNDIRHTLL